MTINVGVTKSGSDNGASVIRKFTRRVQGAGFLRRMRKRKYFARPQSPTVKKKQALRRISRAADHERLVKEGRAPEQPSRGFRRR